MAINKALKKILRSKVELHSKRDAMGGGKEYTFLLLDRFRKGKPRSVASLRATLDKTGKEVHVDQVMVSKEARGFGASKKLFKAIAGFARKNKVSKITGDDIQHPAQVKIREKFDSAFFGEYMGKYGEGSGVVSPSEALDILKSNRAGKYKGQISGVTRAESVPRPEKVKKLKSKSKLNKLINTRGRYEGKVRFIRRNGKIIPIRSKK